jgi:ankyrin repeat protein
MLLSFDAVHKLFEYSQMSGSSLQSVLEELLQNGADVSLRNRWRQTNLHAAVCTKSVDAVRLLLSHQSEINTVYSDGETAMH